MALMSFSRIACKEFRLGYVLSGIKSRIMRTTSAQICSKENRDPDYKKPKPWPYKTKKFTYWHNLFLSTMNMFEENTKIIVVDGNIAVGKTSFAKHLADTFDMVYVAEPNFDRFYITNQGHDLRKLDPIMPPSFKSCDIDTYYKNPYDPNVTSLQFRMFMMRYMDYINAISHLLNTGQGIVLDRCVYSDIVFMKTMFKAGYVRKEAYDFYIEVYNNCMEEILKPHLLIYLDIPADVALERIKKRNNPSEVNSKVLTKEYLEDIEYFYKQHYLKSLENHCEILIYDWSNYGDVEVVIEDIERIDFDRFTHYDEKLKDWRLNDDFEWGAIRRLYTNDKRILYSYATNIPRYELDELHHPTEDVMEYDRIISQIPGENYIVGFNPDVGDKVLFKKFKDYTRQYYYRRHTKYD